MGGCGNCVDFPVDGVPLGGPVLGTVRCCALGRVCAPGAVAAASRVGAGFQFRACARPVRVWLLPLFKCAPSHPAFLAGVCGALLRLRLSSF